jgi:hypothetical protein
MQFAARVEIHNNRYLSLYAAMDAAGFSRFYVHSVTKKRHRAPTGEYWIEANNCNSSAVMAAVQKAVFPIDPTAQIVVSGDGAIIFCNCEEEAVPVLQRLARALFASSLPKPPLSFFTRVAFPHQ